MSEPVATQPSDHPGGRPFLPLLLLFVGSGCAALIYEIVWFQMLELVIGSSAVSMGVLLGTFMGGMCLGSLALPRLVSAGHHPLRVFAIIESGIGFCGLAVLLILPAVARLYVAAVGYGLPGILLRGVICAVCLLFPTMLMGAALPAVSRWVESTPRGIAWLGFLYAGNLAGAVAGCLVAGFYLLRVHDVTVATYVAFALNVLVAGGAFYLAARRPYQAPARVLTGAGPNEGSAFDAATPNCGAVHGTRKECQAVAKPAPRLVYATIAFSGACALAAEVLWTRLLSLMLGATVYTFSIILAVFLVGLGVGGGLGSVIVRRSARPHFALGGCQLLLAAAIAWAACLLARLLPYWPINPTPSDNPWFGFQLDLLRCAWAIWPAACLWGASFPLALAAASRTGQDSGRLVSRVYAANTLGAILGALGCSLVLIPWLGTQQVQRLLIGFSAVGGLLMFLPVTRRQAAAVATTGGSAKTALGFWGAVSLGTGLGCVVLLVSTVPATPWELVAYGRYLPSRSTFGKNLFTGEGISCSVAVTESKEGVRNFHVSGRVEASTTPPDMRLQRMLGHLPALLHPQPRSVLVVGCGSGITAGSLTTYPYVESITICELEPLVVERVARFFATGNYRVLQDHRTSVVFDDARHFVLTTRDKFDIITSDPIHPWVKGAATLYTKEYLEACKRHLKPGGFVSQWVPLYESNLDAVKSEFATFFEVFPNGTVWGNDFFEGLGYDVVLVGQAEPLRINGDDVQDRFSRADYRPVHDSLGEVNFRSAAGLLATYAGDARSLRPWLQGTQINRDRNLRLQYLAGLELNCFQQEAIFSELLQYRRFPGEVFVGSTNWLQTVRHFMERAKAPKQTE